MRSAVLLGILITAPAFGCGPEIFFSQLAPATLHRPTLESHVDRIGRNRAIDTRLPPYRDRSAIVPAPRRDPWRLAAPAGSDALVLGLGTALMMTAAAAEMSNCFIAPCIAPSWQETAALGALIGSTATLTGALAEAGLVEPHDVQRLVPGFGAPLESTRRIRRG